MTPKRVDFTHVHLESIGVSVRVWLWSGGNSPGVDIVLESLNQYQFESVDNIHSPGNPVGSYNVM